MSYGIKNQNENPGGEGEGTGNEGGLTPGQEAWNAVQGPLGMVMSVLGQDSRRNRAYHQMMSQMQNQFRYQQMLNQQGHDLQYDMWKKTSFPAQVRMMKAAGLNPALMYKQGGPGGVTGTQTGGSAAKGDVPAVQPMDMQNLLLGKQAKLLDAQAENVQADTIDKLGKSPQMIQSIAESIARENNLGKDSDLKVAQRLKAIGESRLANARAKIDKERLKRGLTGDFIGDVMSQLGLDPYNNEMDRMLVRGIFFAWYGADFLSKLAKILPTKVFENIFGKYNPPGFKTPR